MYFVYPFSYSGRRRNSDTTRIIEGVFAFVQCILSAQFARSRVFDTPIVNCLYRFILTQKRPHWTKLVFLNVSKHHALRPLQDNKYIFQLFFTDCRFGLLPTSIRIVLRFLNQQCKCNLYSMFSVLLHENSLSNNPYTLKRLFKFHCQRSSIKLQVLMVLTYNSYVIKLS